jgi:hypothetical protein
MTGDQFRKIALSLPEASESAHMNHPDFRIRGKIFATLSGPDEGRGMVKLTPEQQQRFIQTEPEVFVPVNGAWGRRGGTFVHLALASDDTVRSALFSAWRNVAPKRLAQEYEIEE